MRAQARAKTLHLIFTFVLVFTTNGVSGGAATGAAGESAFARQDAEPPTAADRGRTAGRRKVALIVAIADYSDASGWSDLSSDRDLVIIREALERQGFDEIHELTDGAATKAGIEEALGNLERTLMPGDVVVFHYSGHGDQITDNEPPDELDGYDELLVPYDAPRHPAKGYDGSLHVRDDDLNTWLRGLQRKVGEKGEVMVSLDSCFSGTGTRGDARARGDVDPIGPPRQHGEGREVGAGFLDAPAGARGGVVRAPGLGALVAFSAARHDELAWEATDDDGTTVGSLSLALSSALADAGPRTSYRTLFERVKNLMASYRVANTPQAEGALDTALFDGRAVPRDLFFEVHKVNEDGTKLQLHAGTVLGLFAGSQVEIHAADVVDWKHATAITSGTVIEATPLRATIEIDPAVKEKDVANARAYLTQQSFGDLAIVARIEGGKGSWAPQLRRQATKNGANLVQFDGSADVVIREQREGIVVESARDGSRLIGPLANNAELATEVVERLKDYARSRYLRRMEFDSAAYRIGLRMIPCALQCDSFGENCTCSALAEETYEEAGNIQLEEGMGFELELKNEGTSPAYISLLDLMPTGEWAVLWPPANQTPEPIAVGATYKIDDLWEVGPPYGTDMLKLFASETPIDFQWLQGSSGARGPARNPLDQLFATVLDEGEATRGPSSRKTMRADAGVATTALTYGIKPRE